MPKASSMHSFRRRSNSTTLPRPVSYVRDVSSSARRVVTFWMGVIILVAFHHCSLVEAWSPSFESRRKKAMSQRRPCPPAAPPSTKSSTVLQANGQARTTMTRRSLLATASGVMSAVWVNHGNTGDRFLAQAACLPGDTSPDCIGVYKVPMDDRILPYVETPEALKRFAPDMKWVAPIPPPASAAQAWDLIESQRLAADDIVQVVQQGKLEEAGMKILNLNPILTTSGTVILNEALSQLAKQSRNANPDGSNSSGGVIAELAASRLEAQFAMATGLWGETDIMVGQGLRGDLGVSAVAQLQILKQLEESIAALDDFLVAAAKATKRERTP